MANNKKQKKESLNKVLREIDIVFSATIKKLEKLHREKMRVIKSYRETNRQTEIKKIRQSLKNI